MSIVINGISVPYSGERIKKDEFRSNFMITSVVLPEQIKEIDDYAFFNCQCLESVEMSNSLMRIGMKAFDGCVSLKSVRIPKGVKVIETSFSGCEELKSVFIPEGVIKIDLCAFFWCGKLESVNIPNSVIEIGDNAFGECPHLIIKCKKDSYAHKYAIANNLKFQLI